MLIIDAQVHIWGSGTPSDHHRQTPLYSAEDLIQEMNAAGVDGAVLHPPSWDPGSNEMAIAAAVKYPDKFCSLGWFALDDPTQRARIETELMVVPIADETEVRRRTDQADRFRPLLMERAELEVVVGVRRVHVQKKDGLARAALDRESGPCHGTDGGTSAQIDALAEE